MQQNGFFLEDNTQQKQSSGTVTCLGRTFANEQERRKYFSSLLAQKLKDPHFRKIEGFPDGSDEDILNLSDPPYYTACPNPWITDFIHEWEHSKPNTTDVLDYNREPLDMEINASRNNKFVNSHSYATKTPHQAIMQWILHYTNPGDIVLDMFSGTGMTAVAAQLCETPEEEFKSQIESEGRNIKWGARNAIIGDLGVAPTYIAKNLNYQDNYNDFVSEINEMERKIQEELGWMFKTKTSNGILVDIVAVLWSDIYICSNCTEEFSYWIAAVDENKGSVASEIICPHCNSRNNKNKLSKSWVNEYDPYLGTTIKKVKSEPSTIIYDYEGKRYEKKPDTYDINILNRVDDYIIPYKVPIREMPVGYNTEQPRRSHGLTHVHHFFTKRNLALLACAWSVAKSIRAKFLLTSLMYKSSVLCAPLMSNYFAEKKGKPRGGWIGKERSGTLYCPAIHSEVMLLPQIASRAKSVFVFAESERPPIITTQSSTKMSIPSNSIDFIFTDPPFGANRMYSELNFIWESWLGVSTANQKEAIENPAHSKSLNDYRKLLLECFKEYYRVLKPGRWITVEFSNTQALVWNTLQTVISESGFVIAAVNGLDKKQGSIEAYTSAIAVTKDLVISAYKPTKEFEERFLKEVKTENGVWDFVRTHLSRLPIFREQGSSLIYMPERDSRILFDKMVSYYVLKGYPVPISSQEFQTGLSTRFILRDGMYFTSEHVAEYDHKKNTHSELIQLSIFVKDESSAINWLRQYLINSPKEFSDINPEFMQKLSGWSKNEIVLDLRELLSQNFLCYDGQDEVPEKIHRYLSSNWPKLRNLEKNDPMLIAKAKNRWYVPDPNKATDLDKLREKSLLREFEEYKVAMKKLKVFRIEAVRVGFKKLWEQQEYPALIAVADKLPSNVLEEDPVLLMYYDQAVTLSQVDTDDEW